MPLDISLFYLLNSLAGQSPFLDWVIVFFASYLAYILIALFLAYVFFSHYSKQDKFRILLIAGIPTFFARFGVVEFIRLFYQRPRPFVDLPVHQLLTSSEWSFPSGHATLFFALATALYLYNKKWGIGFFIAALLMTMSRVIAGIHYPSDIVAGALIGIAVACATFCIFRKMDATRAHQTY
ncbi:MAG: phosphatase PAP2 family protein [bacterium]|nr:phosphatase PAP2 family protein [bacterium]